MPKVLRAFALANAVCVGVNIASYLYDHNPLNVVAGMFNLVVVLFTTYVEWEITHG